MVFRGKLIFFSVILVIACALTVAYLLTIQFKETGPIVESERSQNKEPINSSAPSAIGNVLPEVDKGILVTRVIDGDTVEIEGGQRVRYIGIDTPETVHPNMKTECFGHNASDKNKDLVEGKHVKLEKDVSETDKYGRLLRYIYVDGLFVNDYLVRQGFANASSYPPDIKYQEELRLAESEARENHRGLWSNCSDSEKAQAPAGDCNIKGNISSSGDKIYHMPGQKYYAKTVIDESKGEKWFCEESEAQLAGFRRSKI